MRILKVIGRRLLLLLEQAAAAFVQAFVSGLVMNIMARSPVRAL